MLRAYKRGSGRQARFRLKGGVNVFNVNAPAPTQAELYELYPVQKIQGKGTPRNWEQKAKKCKAAAVRGRALRQADQATSDAAICTWFFELVPLDGGKAIKKAEMDERTAAVRNRNIKPLGLYWRRAAY